MDQHNGEPGERPGQDEAFDAFGVRSGGAGGGADRGALVPYEPPQAEAPADPTAFDGLRPVEPSLFDAAAPLPKAVRPAREPLELTAGTATPGGGSVRVRRIVTPDYLLTVNPVDGTEVTVCPPEERRTPVPRTPEERAAHLAARRPSPPPGPPAPELPLLERDEERERLIRLLARGRSVRVTGPSGAGRTALLESVANACADLAPDGVLWLSGYRRTVGDVLQALYSTVYAGDDYRPSRTELPGLLRETGAVVVVDDLEFGGAALEELLAAAPECAFLLAATPDVAAPPADALVEEVFLAGLSRVACVDLLTLAAGRPLEEDETAWAADLWFESEGLPLRFVQAGALLRQRDALRFPPEPDWDDSVWENGTPALPAAPAPAGDLIPDLTGFDGPAAPDPSAPLEIPPVTPPAPRVPAADVPLPSLAESAAPADLLASRLSESAREALAFAVALDGECPHPSHLPALVGDTHGDAALGEMTAVGLAVPVAAHYRLAAGVTQQLAAAFAAEGELSEVQAHTAALHYAWWTGHPSVTAARAAAESEAIIAAMSACRDNGNPSAAVLLARTVAPVFAAALHWGAWERTLRIGQEAARLSGEVAEEAYFHHELGVLALCNGTMDRARAELEASIALRGALADRQGTVVGRRTLALVVDAEPAAPLELLPAAADNEPPTVVHPPLAVIHHRAPSHAAHATGPKRLAVVGTRRNLVAVGTGVLLAAVLGTIVTLGATSGSGDDSHQKNQVKPLESAQEEAPDDSATTAPGTTAPTSTPSSATTSPSATGRTSTPSTSTGGTSGGTQGGTSSTPPPNSGPPHHSTGGGSTTGGTSSGGSTTGGTSSGGSTTGGTSSGGSTTGGTSSTGGGSTAGGSTGGPTGGTTTGTTGGPTGGTTGDPSGTPTDTPTTTPSTPGP
ncbi:ATP-binding protein [Actinacidiphila paucisporea]|uniref:AAA family ATPase n=1 Tax=Actinacidiphila paucisporea TaxID=310782 RepID=A0A1M7QVB7_9ACTN|nr:ATP-binding protein [Actinacidiphila paucisporea]SHN35477.1 hypothetical protein SAMN05216499_14337 [Actinacidiphila paucisporea]